MNTKNNCLGWNFLSFINTNNEVALDFKDVIIFYSISLIFNFQLGIISCGLGKGILFSIGDMTIGKISYKISPKNPCIDSKPNSDTINWKSYHKLQIAMYQNQK